MSRAIPKLIRILALVTLILLMWLGGWIGWGSWPGQVVQEIPWRPDMIIVLGGGNDERPREALKHAAAYPEVPVLVTGDGGSIYQALLEGGLTANRLIHETNATSTVENARLTAPVLDELGAERALLVTNWFHVPRSLAVFRSQHPGRRFAAAFEPRPEQLSNWHRHASRRERLAALHHLFRHRIWSF